MNIRVLVVRLLFDQPFRLAAIQLTIDKIVFSSSGELVESETVKPIFEILDVPLQIGMVNIGRSTETWTHNLPIGDNYRLLRKKIRGATNRPVVSDAGNKVCTTGQIEVCNRGVGTFDRNGHLKYNKGQWHELGKVEGNRKNVRSWELGLKQWHQECNYFHQPTGCQFREPWIRHSQWTPQDRSQYGSYPVTKMQSIPSRCGTRGGTRAHRHMASYSQFL